MEINISSFSKLTSILVLILCLFGTFFTQNLKAQGAGILSGRVTEAETNQALPGANVILQGTSLGVATGSDGRYLLSRVPAGSYAVEVSFLGYETQVAQVTIGPGQTTRQDFALSLAVLPGGEVLVLGVRARGQAEALTRQMNAANITNIVASDQMGRFPDANAPEAVQRLPGIAIARDMGEGRYIQIRGGSAQMTQVTFNGEQVPSPEGSVRQIALDAVPVDILEGIEVAKAITPDMDAQAIGGSVNLVTKKAPDRQFFSVEAAGGLATIREDAAGSATVTYGDRAAEGKFGYLFSGSFNRRSFGADDLEPEYDLGGSGIADDLLSEVQVRYYSLWRARLGGTGSFDYRFNENSSMYISGIISELRDDEQRRRLRHRLDRGDYQPDGSVTDARLVFQHKNRRENLQTLNVTAGGDHLMPGGSKIDYHLTLSRSQEDTPRDTEIEFVQRGVDFFPDISDGDNISPNPEAGAVDGIYLFDNIEPASSITKNKDFVAALNLTVPYQLGSQAVGDFKFGGKFRDKNKDQDVDENVAELVDGAGDLILGRDYGSTSFSNDGYNPGNYPYPSMITSPDEVLSFEDRFRSQLTREHIIEDDVNDYDVSEQTVAFYAMTEMNLSPQFMVLPGVRVEHTILDTKGFDFDPDLESLTPINEDHSYTRVFPMVHVRYRPAERTNIRAAFTTTIARPNFFDLVPFRVRDGEDLSIGNPQLDPTTSSNLDLMVEYYDRLIGVISAGVFYKSITDPIFQFVENNELGGETAQPRNGESASIFGVELALQQRLSFLPEPFDGLGVYANYTYTDSEATLPGGIATRLPGQADHVFNAALSYEKGGFSGQVSLNYHDNFVDEFGGDIGSAIAREQNLFIDSHLQLDASASYIVRPGLSVFLELVNLTNEPLSIYQGTRQRPRQVEYYERWGRLGIRYSL